MIRSKKLLSLSGALALLLLASPLALVGQDEESDAMFDQAVEEQEADAAEEQAAVEFSVEELQRMAALPSSSAIGKESQEDLDNPISIFENEERVKQMLGEKPKFIYFPEGVDPMIIPWVRNEIIARELFDEATLAESTGDYEKALEILNSLAEEYPETEVAPSIPAARSRVTNKILDRDRPTNSGDTTIAPPSTDRVELPQRVKQDTFGVILSDSEPLLIWGDEALRVGDTVPGFGGVRVKSIAPSEVVYIYQDKEFEVQIQGGF